MIGYGMAKAAVHQLVQSLNSSDGGLPPDAGVVGILPYVMFRDKTTLLQYCIVTVVE